MNTLSLSCDVRHLSFERYVNTIAGAGTTKNLPAATFARAGRFLYKLIRLFHDQLASHLGMSAAAHRIAEELERAGFVRREGDGLIGFNDLIVSIDLNRVHALGIFQRNADFIALLDLDLLLIELEVLGVDRNRRGIARHRSLASRR